MAEQIPYSVAESLINRLASLAFREFRQIYGVRGELERLKNTIESIKAVLLDAEEKQERDHAVKVWIRKLKEILHAADDLLDDFAIEDLRHTVAGVSSFVSSSNPIFFRRQMAHKIKKIRKNINDVAEDMSKLNLSTRTMVIKENENTWNYRETCSFVLESQIIGRKDSKMEIINLLKQSHGNQSVSLIAIVGIGGLGKTAIAQLVYKDVEVQNFFQKRMWVCVSNNFDVKIIVMKILESLIVSKRGDPKLDQLALDKLSLDSLQNKLHEHLSGQRYLLVLDDIWNENNEKLTQLRNYLMCGAQGSKILLTTRSKIVARKIGVSTSYDLKVLSTEESWSLLRNIVFGEDAKGMNHTLESIGNNIAEKCGGVPLAIKTVGGLLQCKDEEREWIGVLDGEFWKLCEDKDSIMPVLKLSYQNLSPQLRQCFAYCSLYPKDWKINKNELIQLWMAHGYLECSTEKQHMEDLGNQFVKMLLMKSFFQDAEINSIGEVHCFKMHDLMHDLATLVAGDDCFLDGERKELVKRPMHVSLDSNTNAIGLLDSLDATRLRTLFLWSKNIWEGTKVRSRRELSVISSFELLRVLNLSCSSFKKLPDSIGMLKHLRYLDLSHCYALASLPKSISNLVCLQTLKLSMCLDLQISTKVVTKLINLRHLDIRRSDILPEMEVPAGLGKLSSLQFLSNFVVGDGRKKKTAKLNELKELNNLRGHLRIDKLNQVRDVALESQEVNLKGKSLLQSLHLDWTGCANYNNDSVQLLENLRPHQALKELTLEEYPGVRFSNWLSSLTNISHITLIGCRKCQYLPPLERLPSLKSLYISVPQALEYICFEVVNPTAITFFPSLESLWFDRCENLSGWRRMGDDVSDPHHLSLPPFPRLSKLEISGCPKLTCMPTFPHLVEGLLLESCSVKPLSETLNIAPSISSSSSSSFTPLSMLESLTIGGELVDIKALPNQWMRNLTSLGHLTIEGSKSLALEEFEMLFVDSLNCLPSLQKITIKFCGELKALPNWMCSFPSLQHIEVSYCHNVESLPEGMPHLTNLQTLEIKTCPLLLERCQRETGVEWRKIAHVPNII